MRHWLCFAFASPALAKKESIEAENAIEPKSKKKGDLLFLLLFFCLSLAQLLATKTKTAQQIPQPR